MKDITRVFQDFCLMNNINYQYGQRHCLNLLNELKCNQVYFLHDRNVRNKANTQDGTSERITFTGSVFLVVKSDCDKPFFKEKMQQDKKNKYESNIEPLLELVGKFEKSFNCSDYTLSNIQITDVVDLLDFNADGLFIEYTINV